MQMLTEREQQLLMDMRDSEAASVARAFESYLPTQRGFSLKRFQGRAAAMSVGDFIREYIEPESWASEADAQAAEEAGSFWELVIFRLPGEGIGSPLTICGTSLGSVLMRAQDFRVAS